MPTGSLEFGLVLVKILAAIDAAVFVVWIVEELRTWRQEPLRLNLSQIREEPSVHDRDLPHAA